MGNWLVANRRLCKTFGYDRRKSRHSSNERRASTMGVSSKTSMATFDHYVGWNYCEFTFGVVYLYDDVCIGRSKIHFNRKHSKKWLGFR